MQSLSKFCLVALMLAGSMPLTAGVLVSSPVNGSSVVNPVLYTAAATTTTCSKGVGSMGIYVDDVLLSVTSGDSLNSTLVVAPGAHKTVVEEWDKCGGASYTKLSITVAQPVAAPPAFSLPSGAYTSVQLVALSDASPGAAIYYTTDGSIPSAASALYTGAIPVASSETINAIAVAPGYTNSPIGTAIYGVTLPTAPPAFSLSSGTYTSVQSLMLSDATPGASIYYTTDGSIPTTASLRFGGPILVGATQTINAIALAPSYSNSPLSSAAYTVTLPTATPLISLPSGTYTSVQSVMLSDATPGASIYYTTDGSIPTTASMRYAGAITVGATQTINAMASAPSYSNSPVSSAAYTVTLPTLPPAFSVPSGAYTTVQSVTLTDATPGAVIYYTPDGTAPTTSSIQYVTAIPVSNTETISAIAVAPAYSVSPLASAAYTVTLPAATPTFSVPAGTYTAVQSVVLSDTTPGATIHYTFNGAAPTPASALYTGPLSVGATETINAIAVAPGYSTSGTASAIYTVNLPPPGPVVPDDAISATALQMDPRWTFTHDAGTLGDSVGALTVVSNPSLSGNAGEFITSYTNWGGEIYHLSYASDTASSNFVYDAQVWIQQGSNIGNLEMDMNQVIAAGDTVIFGFQCDGDNGTWDYSGNVGAISVSRVSWVHSSQPCNPAQWTPNTWHHVQISYSRDSVGNVTYNSVWLDGVEAVIGVTTPSAQSLAWALGHLLTNFQVDGVGASGSSILYLDNLTISRW